MERGGEGKGESKGSHRRIILRRGDGKNLTAPRGCDTINTTEARQFCERGWKYHSFSVGSKDRISVYVGSWRYIYLLSNLATTFNRYVRPPRYGADRPGRAGGKDIRL